MLNLAHLGLAVASLLTWIAYLATGVLGLAWTACAGLALVTGLGMTLAFLPPPVRSARDTPASGDSWRGRRTQVFAVGAHVAFATVTILFAFLAAVGIG